MISKEFRDLIVDVKKTLRPATSDQNIKSATFKGLELGIFKLHLGRGAWFVCSGTLIKMLKVRRYAPSLCCQLTRLKLQVK